MVNFGGIIKDVGLHIASLLSSSYLALRCLPRDTTTVRFSVVRLEAKLFNAILVTVLLSRIPLFLRNVMNDKISFL
ncbi:MAG: hypothetical protein ACI9V1_001840 [Spirosomataceae bacterium]|jgi:hypothetical protein